MSRGGVQTILLLDVLTFFDRYRRDKTQEIRDNKSRKISQSWLFHLEYQPTTNLFLHFFKLWNLTFLLFAGAWVNCQPITFYCADDNFCQWPWEKRVREKKWDGKINVSQTCSSHMLKTIKSGKEFSGKQIVGIFHYLFTFKYELWIILLLNFILKRSNSEPPNYRREQVTVLGKNRKKIKPGCTKKFKPGYL